MLMPEEYIIKENHVYNCDFMGYNRRFKTDHIQGQERIDLANKMRRRSHLHISTANAVYRSLWKEDTEPVPKLKHSYLIPFYIIHSKGERGISKKELYWRCFLLGCQLTTKRLDKFMTAMLYETREEAGYITSEHPEKDLIRHVCVFFDVDYINYNVRVRKCNEIIV